MTSTTPTLEPTPTRLPSDAKRRSLAAGLRQHWLALVVMVALVALSVWTLVALRASSATAERSPVSVRQVERADLQRQGVASYDDLAAVRRSRQRYGDTTTSALTPRDRYQMELGELHRLRSRVPASARADVDAGMRRLEGLVGSTVDE